MTTEVVKMNKTKLGEQESALLAWVAAHAPASVAQILAGWGNANGLARTTVTTMLERLRAKGYLKREKLGVAFVYAPKPSMKSSCAAWSGGSLKRRWAALSTLLSLI